MLISDHLLAMFFTVSPMWQSDLIWKLFQEKKIRGIAQLIPNFCHSQASCLLPYPVQAKGRLGRKAHCEFLALCAPLSPAPCMRRACSISLWCTPQHSKNGLPGSGEKLEDPRKKRESCRFIPGLGRDWLWRLGEKEGWGVGRKAIKIPGSKVHYGAGGGLEVQDSAS